MEGDAIRQQSLVFWAKEKWKLKEDIVAETNVEVDKALVVKGFRICKGTSITIVSANPLSKSYTFTVDILQNVLVNADTNKPLVFRIEASELEKQRRTPQISIFAEN